MNVRNLQVVKPELTGKRIDLLSLTCSVFNGSYVQSLGIVFLSLTIFILQQSIDDGKYDFIELYIL